MVIWLLVIMFCIVGCAGQQANPVDRYFPGDEKKSCPALLGEITEMDKQVVLRKQKIKERDTWNVVFFVTGFLVIVPWFLMDCKNSQEVEIRAYEDRKAALKIIAAEKDCAIVNSASEQH